MPAAYEMALSISFFAAVLVFSLVHGPDKSHPYFRQLSILAFVGNAFFEILRLRRAQHLIADAKQVVRLPVGIFAAYELHVLDALVRPHLGASALDAIVRDARVVSYDCNGAGYMLTVAHPSVPTERTVCSDPMLTGLVNEALCGFVVFLERGELSFECFTFDGTVPEDIRNLDVTIRRAT